MADDGVAEDKAADKAAADSAAADKAANGNAGDGKKTESKGRTLLDLVDDAKILAHYGAMTGKIRDTVLLAAIADVEKLPEPGWTDEPTIRLVNALSDAIQTVAPLTLMDLRDWRPERPRRGFFQFQPMLIALSFLLMLATFYCTSQYTQGALILDQVSQLKTENAAWTFNKTVYDIIRVATPGDASEAVDEERFLEYVQKLRDLNDRASSYTDAARTWVSGDIGLYLMNAASQIGFLFKPVGEATAIEPPRVETRFDPRFVRLTLPQQTSCDMAVAPTVIEASATGTTDLATNIFGSQLPETSGTKLAEEFWSNFQQIVCLNVGSIPDMRRLEVIVSDLKLRTGNLALWLLPALYGALGASVFYMRRVLDPTLPDPPLPRLIYRIALGGFAGIIFGWFWQPTSEFNAGFSSIGINVFGWAFLVGFSVEVFFALLDRLVTVLTAWARKIGATPTDTALPHPN